MKNDFAEQISGITSQLLDTVTNLQKIQNEAVQTLVTQQLDGMQQLISSSTRQLQELAKVKSPEEAASLQLKIANEFSEKVVSQTQENIAALQKSQDQVKTLVNTEMKAFFEKSKGSSGS